MPVSRPAYYYKPTEVEDRPEEVKEHVQEVVAGLAAELGITPDDPDDVEDLRVVLHAVGVPFPLGKRKHRQQNHTPGTPEEMNTYDMWALPRDRMKVDREDYDAFRVV